MMREGPRNRQQKVEGCADGLIIEMVEYSYNYCFDVFPNRWMRRKHVQCQLSRSGEVQAPPGCMI
jgi:hypothetical protein